MKKLFLILFSFISGFMCCILIGVRSIIKDGMNSIRSKSFYEGYEAGYFAAKRLFTEEDDFSIDD